MTIVTLYETLFVVHPEKAPRAKEFIDRFKKILEGQGGTVSQTDEWGLRDLAYRIAKQSKGFYVLLQYRAPARGVEELERNLKLTDGILRFLTVRLDERGVSAAPAKGHSVEPGQTTEEGLEKSESQP